MDTSHLPSKASTALSQVKKLTEKYQNASGTSRLMMGGGFGAAAGLFQSITNDKEDGVLGTAKNVVIGAGIDMATDKLAEDFLGSDRVTFAKNLIGGSAPDTASLKENAKAAAKTAFRGPKKAGLIGGAVAGVVLGDREGVGNVLDAGVYGLAGYGVGALMEQRQIDQGLILPNEVPKPQKVPKKSAEVKPLPEIEDTPKAGEANRVTTPKMEADLPKTTPQGTTTGSLSGQIDAEASRQAMDETRKVTTQDVSQDIDSSETRKVMNEAKIKAVDPGMEAQKALKHKKRLVLGGRVAVGLMAVGVVADINNNLAQERRSKRMVNEAENNLKKKEHREKQDMNKMFGYDYMDYGNIVQEMWNNRTGHHKMGNAKFQ